MPDSPSECRTDFLLGYYKVLWDNINRHILGVWQTVTTLGVSVVLLSLAGAGTISLSLAAALIVGLCAWYSATAYDSGLWFARNQLIASNVERLFLTFPDDLRLVQPYFEERQPAGAGKKKPVLIGHFQIALWLSRGLAGFTLAAHAVDVVQTLSLDAEVDPVKALPFVAAIAYVVAEVRSARSVRRSYDKLVAQTAAPQTASPQTVPPLTPTQP